MNRFGEMERDCMISHGASKMLRDRLLDNSDAFKSTICEICGTFCVANVLRGSYECKACNNTTNFANIEIPYACKLLFQELMALTIYPKVIVT